MIAAREIIVAAVGAAIMVAIITITGAVSYRFGYLQGWTVGSACTAAANPASAGNVSHGLGACAPP